MNIPLHSCAILRLAAFVLLSMLAFSARSATITVNSLADDVFPDATGAVFDVNGAPVTIAAAKCTLRMAIAAANLDLAVGGANGCVAGDSDTTPTSAVQGVPDTIRFIGTIAGTISLNVAKKMSEAPAIFRDPATGNPTPNSTSALVVSRPLVIVGNTASGLPTIVLDGDLVTNSSVDGRLLWVFDGNNVEDTPFSMSNMALRNARVVGAAGGCLLTHETIFLSNVSFTNCVSEGNATLSGVGGALAIYTRAVVGAPAVRPAVRLQSVTVSNSKALRGSNAFASEAGAIAIGSGFNFAGYAGNVALSGVTVDNNEADNFGGICISLARNVDVARSVISNNRASGPASLDSGYSAGMRIQSSADVALTEVQVLNNTAGSGRAGLELRSNAGTTAIGLTVTGNSVSNASNIFTKNAGLRIAGGTTVVGHRWNISNNVLTGSATSGGSMGGLSVETVSSSVVLRDLTVTNNVCTDASECAMLFLGNGSVDIQGMVSRGNVATKTGTAWAANAGFSAQKNTSLRLANAEISGNVTGDNEVVSLRASFADTTGYPPVAVSPLPPVSNTILIENSTISGNTANGSFILYVATPGQYTFRNMTVANNSALGGCGGGMTVQSFAPFSGVNAVQVNLQNSTIARNNASCQVAASLGAWDGAQNVVGNGYLSIESSVLGREAASGVRDVIWSFEPSRVTLNKTLIEDNAGPMSAQCSVNGNQCNADPLLDALALNGGPTATMRLLPGSPAINAGSNPASLTTDQRGAARVVGAAADMGAFEAPATSSACNLDMDGDNVLSATKEGVVLTRAMLGFTGSAITAGTGITATQWANARLIINANCGTTFAP